MIHNHDWFKPDLKLSHVQEKCIVDPITYKDWIMAVMCNIPDKELDQFSVRHSLFEILDTNIKEASEIARNADKSIFEYVKKERSTIYRRR